ncbi:contractile injection system protein, VgrG/Pvc8 family [Roseibium litorale]|uniref:Phage protein D n=1 Tax=Roseibium litorale TaxID=2803841 RepID=A0ABR9CJ70_9HYPH|nr:contractile injection system protein, VgrG/Pvc8 family [Roseibium litorale]MBD8890886.1 hypothetical protein [Roseibium litorale]
MTPIFLVSVAGLEIAGLVGQGGLLNATVTDEAGIKSDACDLEFARSALSAPPPPGSPILIAFGYKESGLGQIWRFVVDEAETSGSKSGGHLIKVSGTAADMTQGFKEERTESYDNKTIGQIVKTIAGRNKLQPVVSQKLASVMIKHRDQTQESDLHFLQGLARDYGATVKAAEGKLAFLEKRSGQSAGGSALDALGVPTFLITDYRWRGAKRGEFKSVRAAWHDQKEAKKKYEEAGSGKPQKTLKRTFPDQEAAKKAAEAELRETASTAEISLTLPGNPIIRAERPIFLPPIQPELVGQWIVTRAVHRCSKSGGYTTDVEARKQV